MTTIALVNFVHTNLSVAVTIRGMMRMMIINQTGTAAYNFENIVSVSCSDKYIKITLSRTISDHLPSIAIADYSTSEVAQKQFDKFLCKCAIGGVKGVFQFPLEEGEKDETV